MQIAQSTGLPYSGASNAEDFQPQTRNPQDNVSGAQSQNSNLQSPVSMDALSNQDLRIVVPSGGGGETAAAVSREKVEVAEAKSGVGDVVAIAVLFTLVFAIMAFIVHRRQKASNRQKEVQPPVTPEPKKSVKKTNKKTKKSKKKKK